MGSYARVGFLAHWTVYVIKLHLDLLPCNKIWGTERRYARRQLQTPFLYAPDFKVAHVDMNELR